MTSYRKLVEDHFEEIAIPTCKNFPPDLTVNLTDPKVPSKDRSMSLGGQKCTLRVRSLVSCGPYHCLIPSSCHSERLGATRFSADIQTIVTRFDRNTKHVFRNDNELHHITFTSPRERDQALGIRGGRITLDGYASYLHTT